MARIVLGLLIPLAQGGSRGGTGNSGAIIVLVIFLVGLLALAIRWNRARQRRLQESPVFYEDEDRLSVEPEYEEGELPMTRLYAEGMNGQIEVDDEWVRIHRKGFLAHSTRGLRGTIGRGVQIRLSDIEDIEISYPRLTQRGWIRFLTGGEDRIGIREAVYDQATVLFTKGSLPAIEELRQQVKALIARQTNAGLVQAIAEGVAATTQVDFATQVRELAALRDDGLLTEEEFQTKKAQLLSQG